jgi:uncharacterized protein (DUF4213/DUF364 family)
LIKQTLSPACEGIKIGRACVGYIYSAVQLENQATGVAFTFPRGEHCRHSLLDGQNPLEGRAASEVISFLGDRNLVSSSLALATVNAVVSSTKMNEGAEQGDILDVLDIRTGDRVCMIGCFLPLMKPLESRQVRVIAFDEIPKPGTSKPKKMERILSKSQIAIITATSIINNTIDDLLALSRSCREVTILGPSTPLIASAFRKTAVTCLSGIQITAPDLVQRVIAEGGGFRDFRKHVMKLNVRIDRV